MKHCIYLFFLLLLFSGNAQEDNRIETIKNQLGLLAVENTTLNDQVKVGFNVKDVTLPNFLLALSKIHNLNISIAPEIGAITLVNNFSDVTVSDLLVYLCKEYNLTIEFTGNILAIKPYTTPAKIPVVETLKINYTSQNNLLSLDLKNEPLGAVFRRIMDVSGKNLLFSSGLEEHSISLYLSGVPFEIALEKLAVINGLKYSRSKDGFYLFDSYEQDTGRQASNKKRLISKDIGYQVLDTVNRILKVDFEKMPLSLLIQNLKRDLGLNIYTAAPLAEAGAITFNAAAISFDDLLTHIFNNNTLQRSQVSEDSATNRRSSGGLTTSSSLSTTKFTFRKENDIYFFGTANQLNLRKTEVIQMMHRSVELLGNPSSGKNERASGRTTEGNINYFGNDNTNQPSNFGGSRNVSTQNQQFEDFENGAEAIVSILPDEIKADLEIKVDYELNSFLVSGPAVNVNKFKEFLKKIDKPVPVVLIEVMIIEVRKSSSVETGISWGIGDAPVTTQGRLFPTTDVTLGANTVNKIIGGFDGFGSFNMGKVIPEFFANIKAMEENGNLKIRSSPKLSTLNGHRATLSIGETTYYVVTNQNFFGSQIPTTSQVRNYLPIDAELAIGIKPLVSGDGQVTLDINVVQSDFSGERIEEDAPPGLTSREFSSIIRMQNQDLAILGGLEEKVKNDTGSGIPILARIPIIKWLFSSRKREDNKQKLTILIKPTVIY